MSGRAWFFGTLLAVVAWAIIGLAVWSIVTFIP